LATEIVPQACGLRVPLRYEDGRCEAP
jgi:hypothetical protein